MNSMQLIIYFFIFVFLGTGTTSAISDAFADFVHESALALNELLSLPSFDATSLHYGNTTRCGQNPLFEIGKQTFVKVSTTNGERLFIVYIPTSYANHNGRRTPLHVLFHELNGNCKRFIDTTGLIAYAEREGYILASACGTLGLLGLGWNAGTCCGFSNPNAPDDFQFAKKIVDTIIAGACVDTEKTMASGFSNGAMMAQALGCRMPKLFRAIVSVGGILELRPGNEEGLSECGRVIRVNNAEGIRPNVLIVHGNFDILVPVIGNRVLGFPSLNKNIETWKNLNGCREGGKITFSNNKYRNRIYTSCQSVDSVLYQASLTTQNRTRNAAAPQAVDRSASNHQKTTVEVVYALFGGHTWMEDDQFSSAKYVNDFGKRVFSGY